MTAPHRIRLHGPWEITPVAADAGPLPPSRRMTVPCTWKQGGWPGFRGRAVHRRSFGKPSNLGAAERVWLIILGVNGQASVRLNDRALGPIDEGAEFVADITDFLAARNCLDVEIACASDSGGIAGEVRLEIKSRA
jgi:hypothetical protein